MLILDCQPNWHIGYANDPTFVVTVDALPDHKELRYKQHDTLYWAENEGYVSFFYYAAPGDGYGGRVFNITMEDGREVALKGPWSSRAGVLNQVFPHCTEVSFVDKSSPYKSSPYNSIVSGAILVSTLTEALEKYRPDVEIRRVPKKDNEIVYAPAFKYAPGKWERDYNNRVGDIFWLRGEAYTAALQDKIEGLESQLKYCREEYRNRKAGITKGF